MGRQLAVLRHRGFAVALMLLAGWLVWHVWWLAPPTEFELLGPAGVILALHALARRYPLRLVRDDASSEVQTSTAFGFAVLLLLPAPLALAGLSITSFVPSPHRSGNRRLAVLVDAARCTLTYGTAAWALVALRGLLAAYAVPVEGSWELLLVVLPAGVVAFVVQSVVSVLATAAEQGASLPAVLRQDHVLLDAPAFLLLVGLAPAIALISQHAPALAPLLLLAIAGLYRSSRFSIAQEQEARHDALTGLVNRRHLETRLVELIEHASLADRFALLLMDLDRFKEVNDRLGHHVGDQLLTEVGTRLQALDGIDVAARIGGDEFAFVLRGAREHDELVAAGHRLVAEVTKPYVVADVRLSIGASIGIATFPDHGLDVPSLLRRADSAMYDAKRSGVPIGLATVHSESGSPGRVSLLAELEEAMDAGQLKLDFQPQLSLRTGEVVGVESLLRWHHPQHGLVPPSAFVATVEHTELIAPLTRHVLGLALEDAARWKVAGVTVPVAVNISARDLQDTRFPRTLEDLLGTNGFPASDLTLEITETALQVDPDRARRVLLELRELGVALSVDDFGTGYSSLAALRTLPVSELKIDRTFVRGMAEPAGVAIVHSIVQLAHALGLRVVAEGVEEQDDLEELARHECDAVQGYLLSRPLPAHLVAPWVRARREERREAAG